VSVSVVSRHAFIHVYWPISLLPPHSCRKAHLSLASCIHSCT
jgi:hypothetical protein